jgi:hypothetical protein
VLGDMKNLKCCVYFCFYYIWNYIINGDRIYFVSEINISGKYLRLKKRYIELVNVRKYAKSSRILKKKNFIVKLITDILNNSKGICVYATDSFLTYLFMPVVVVAVPNSYRKLGGD